MKHLLNILGAIVFGLVVSVDYVGAAPKEEPAHVGNLSPVLAQVCTGNTNMTPEACIRSVVGLMKFSRSIGRSELSCSVIKANDFAKQDRCKEFEQDVDVRDFYMWMGGKQLDVK